MYDTTVAKWCFSLAPPTPNLWLLYSQWLYTDHTLYIDNFFLNITAMFRNVTYLWCLKCCFWLQQCYCVCQGCTTYWQRWATKKSGIKVNGHKGERNNWDAEWGGIWGGVSPSQPTMGSVERRELTERGSGWSPGRAGNAFWTNFWLTEHVWQSAKCAGYGPDQCTTDTFGPKLTLFGTMRQAAYCGRGPHVVHPWWMCLLLLGH